MTAARRADSGTEATMTGYKEFVMKWGDMIMRGDTGRIRKRADGKVRRVAAADLALRLNDRFASAGGMLTNVGIPIEIRGGGRS
jgi:hypothetical protein